MRALDRYTAISGLLLKQDVERQMIFFEFSKNMLRKRGRKSRNNIRRIPRNALIRHLSNRLKENKLTTKADLHSNTNAPDGIADGCQEHFDIETNGPVCVICLINEIERLRSVLIDVAESKPLTATHSQMVRYLQRIAREALPLVHEGNVKGE